MMKIDGEFLGLQLEYSRWLSRLKGSPRFALADKDETWTIDTLSDAWAQTSEGWREWVSGVSDFEQVLEYKNLAGQSHSLPLWQAVLHVVNHATYHRGQITTMVRQLGYTPICTCSISAGPSLAAFQCCLQALGEVFPRFCPETAAFRHDRLIGFMDEMQQAANV